MKGTDRYAVGAIECKKAMTFSSAISVQRKVLALTSFGIQAGNVTNFTFAMLVLYRSGLCFLKGLPRHL